MAAAACADLLACGVIPEFLLQSWNIDESEPPEYYAEVARGIESVLRHYGARCIGGDMGCSRPWSWTATVGAKAVVSPIRWIASAEIPFDLYVSGPLGDANRAAFSSQPMPLIELRDPVQRNALFATDTSGGFMDGLENFRRVNPRLSIQLGDIPIVHASDWSFPKEMTLIGGVGEYELLYAVPRGENADGIKIGSGDFLGQGIRFKNGGVMRNPPPDYRNLPPDKWFSATQQYYMEVFL